MNMYAILRRNEWRSPDDLGAAAERRDRSATRRCRTTFGGSGAMSSRRAPGPRNGVHLRSDQPGSDPRTRWRADLPVDEIIPILDTVVVRSDPKPAAATN